MLTPQSSGKRRDYRRQACDNLAAALKDLSEKMTQNPNLHNESDPNVLLANFWSWLTKGLELPIWGPAMTKTTRCLQLDSQSQYLCIIQKNNSGSAPAEVQQGVTAMMHLSEVRECVWRNRGFLFFPNPHSTEMALGTTNGMSVMLEFPSRGLLDYFRWRMAELIFAVDRLEKQYEVGVARRPSSSHHPNQEAPDALELLSGYRDPWGDNDEVDRLLDLSVGEDGPRNAQECHVMNLPSCGPHHCLFSPFSCISALLCIKSDPDYHSRKQEVVGCGPCSTDYKQNSAASVDVLLLGQDSPNVLT